MVTETQKVIICTALWSRKQHHKEKVKLIERWCVGLCTSTRRNEKRMSHNSLVEQETSLGNINRGVTLGELLFP